MLNKAYILHFITTIHAFLIAFTHAQIRCDDLLTRRAIQKRERQINLKCIENKKRLEKCDNRTDVDFTWMDFERINVIYATSLESCKKSQRRKRYYDCTGGNDTLCHHYLTKKFQSKRHIHGTNDDKNDSGVINDYSKDFVITKRHTCLEEVRREETRLLEKFVALCDANTIPCDRDNLNQAMQANLNKLSKERLKAYTKYVESFQLCYGPIL